MSAKENNDVAVEKATENDKPKADAKSEIKGIKRPAEVSRYFALVFFLLFLLFGRSMAPAGSVFTPISSIIVPFLFPASISHRFRESRQNPAESRSLHVENPVSW